jgi:two-component system nitrate/nitrite response regulator NarL
MTSQPTAPLAAIVAEPHPSYRHGVMRALAVAGESVVAEADDGRQALELIRRWRPDVALVAVRMPGMSGLEITASLACEGPDVPVVLLAAFGDAALIRAGLEAGAAAYVTKDADRSVIVRALRAAAGPAQAPRALAGGIRDLVVTPQVVWHPAV